MDTKDNSRGMVAAATYKASSLRLMQCLIDLDHPQPHVRTEASLELMNIAGGLMPKGVPALLETRNYPPIALLEKEHGRKHLLKVLYLLVRDFCQGMNVVRNMNQQQAMEAAGLLLDECDNFRLEDYHMMFTMAKRVQLVRIYDRIDISVINDIMNEFWRIRNEAGRRHQQQIVYKEPENPVDPERVHQFFQQFTEELKKNTTNAMDEEDYQRIRREYMIQQLKKKEG